MTDKYADPIHHGMLDEHSERPTDAAEFQETAAQSKASYFKNNLKVSIMIIGNIIVIFLIVLLIACDPDFARCGKKKK